MNTNLKRAIVGLALLFSMGMANAIPYSMGTVITSGYTTGSISDIYNFSLPSLSEVIANVIDSSVPPHNINKLNLTLDGALSPPYQTYFDVFLSSGPHSFTVTGNVPHNKLGRYTFFASVVPSGPQVPEPSTWAMMLGGLGLIGFMSYRRRQYL
jgi:hypothetical protein